MKVRMIRFRVLLMLAAGMLVPELVFPSDDLAPQNPTLRSYFLQSCLEIRYGLPAFLPPEVYQKYYSSSNRRLIDRHIDESVTCFLTDMRQKRDALWTHFQEARSAYDAALAAPLDRFGRLDAVARWKRSLEKVSDQARDLRAILSLVLSGAMREKTDFNPVLPGDTVRPRFDVEMQFIQQEIADASRRIQNYFFESTHTVSVEELKGNNMMINLNRVELMSKKLGEAAAFHAAPNAALPLQVAPYAGDELQRPRSITRGEH